MNLRLMRLMKMHKLMDKADDLNGGGGGPGAEPSGQTGDKKSETGDNPPADDKSAATGDKTPSADDKKGEDSTILRDLMKEKDRRRAAQEELNSVKAQLEELNGVLGGLDKNSLAQVLGDYRSRQEQEAIQRGDYESLKAQIAAERESERQQFTARESQLQQEVQTLRDQLEELTIGSAFASSKLISEELTLPAGKARQLFGAHFDIVDGKVVGFDKPRGAQGRVQLVGADGEALSFEAALNKLIDSDPDRDALRRARQRPGAASAPQDNQPRKAAVEIGVGQSRIAAALAAKK